MSKNNTTKNGRAKKWHSKMVWQEMAPQKLKQNATKYLKKSAAHK
jgi:hypothetical protein